MNSRIFEDLKVVLKEVEDGPAWAGLGSAARPLSDLMWVLLLPRYLPGVVAAIELRQGTGVNDFSFRYCNPELMDQGEEPWEGVEVDGGQGTGYIPEAVFERLMCRAIRLFLALQPLSSPEAASVEEQLQKIEARCGQGVHPVS